MCFPPKPVNEVVEENNISWRVFFLERATGRCGDNVGATLLLQSPDVCAVVDAGWVDAMLPPVSKKNSTIHSIISSDKTK